MKSSLGWSIVALLALILVLATGPPVQANICTFDSGIQTVIVAETPTYVTFQGFPANHGTAIASRATPNHRSIDATSVGIDKRVIPAAILPPARAVYRMDRTLGVLSKVKAICIWRSVAAQPAYLLRI